MWTSTRIVVLLAALFVAADAVPYSKYGRTCKDIGCRPNEVCVMAEDPCTGQSESCGRYPTCSRSSESCTTMVCPGGQYCKTENGRPTCVNKDPGPAFDSAGVSAVNGQQLPTNRQPSVPADASSGSRYASSNPYANANAPPADEVNHNDHPSYGNPAYPPYPNTNNHNNGYPPYPSNNGNNAGYPPYPTNNNNNGYPQYPPSSNGNRPSVAVDQYGYPIYPATQPRPDNRPYNTYPQHNLPQHNPGWGNNYPNTYKRNGASPNSGSLVVLLGSILLSAMSLGMIKV